MILASIFNHNGELLLLYMLLISSIAFISVMPQFSRNKKYGLNLFGLGILTFAMALMPIQCGDFFYYGKMLQDAVGISHLEDFYLLLWAKSQDYLLWRTLIWGSSTILLILSIKRLKLNPYFSSFIFIITEFYYFGTTRNMLGYMVMLYSVFVIFCPFSNKHKIFSWAIGALGIYCSFFLHRSMYLYLLFLIPALIPFGKRFMKVSLLCFPILYGMVFVMARYFLIYFSTGEDLQISAEGYVNDILNTTFMQSLNSLIRYASYLYLLYIVVRESSKKTIIMPSVFKYLTRYSFLLIYLGSLFLGQVTGGWLFIRFTGAGELAFMFVMMYFFYRYPRTKGVKLAFAGLIYFILYNIAYITYYNASFIGKVNTITL